MSIGIVGIKRGMTRVFDENGKSVPVTVVEATPNRVTQRKTTAKDSYEAIQVTSGEVDLTQLSGPVRGHYSSKGVEPGRGLWELRLDENVSGQDLEPGYELNVSQFEVGEKVDVSGVSIGKGFAGAVKRWNFSTQDATHGNSLSHRALGSTGQCQTPGKVFKGKKMPGHLGNKANTTQNLEIVKVDPNLHLLLIKGAVVGPKGSEVLVSPATKKAAGQSLPKAQEASA